MKKRKGSASFSLGKKSDVEKVNKKHTGRFILNTLFIIFAAVVLVLCSDCIYDRSFYGVNYI